MTYATITSFHLSCFLSTVKPHSKVHLICILRQSQVGPESCLKCVKIYVSINHGVSLFPLVPSAWVCTRFKDKCKQFYITGYIKSTESSGPMFHSTFRFVAQLKVVGILQAGSTGDAR